LFYLYADSRGLGAEDCHSPEEQRTCSKRSLQNACEFVPAHHSLNIDAPEFVLACHSLNTDAPEFVPAGHSLNTDVPEFVPAGFVLNTDATEFVPSHKSLSTDAPEFVPTGQFLSTAALEFVSSSKCLSHTSEVLNSHDVFAFNAEQFCDSDEEDEESSNDESFSDCKESDEPETSDDETIDVRSWQLRNAAANTKLRSEVGDDIRWDVVLDAMSELTFLTTGAKFTGIDSLSRGSTSAGESSESDSEAQGSIARLLPALASGPPGLEAQ